MASEHILQFFTYAHLPPHLQAISRPFAVLAHDLVGEPLDGVTPAPERALPRNPERSVTLRKLLESKDAAVRAAIAKDSTSVDEVGERHGASQRSDSDSMKTP